MSKNRAAIDLGTNSFRMLVADAKAKSFTAARKNLSTVRLGEGIKNHRLSTTAINRGLAALTRFKQQLTDDIEIIACGTAVFRKVTNGSDFLLRAESLLGAKIEVLTPEKEAFLSRIGTLLGFNESTNNFCITIDAGGGSTELSFAYNSVAPNLLTEEQCFCTSLPVGAVSLTETFLGNTIRSTINIDRLRQSAQKTINKGLNEWKLSFEKKLEPSSPTLVASGGTATALACLDLGLKEYDAAKIQGHILHNSSLCNILKGLTNLSPQQANAQPGLDNRRGEIIVAGLIILQSIADFWSCREIIVSDSGLLEGIFLAGKQ